MKINTCCFLGQILSTDVYQPYEDECTLSLIIRLVLEIETMINKGCTEFIALLYPGPDFFFAECVLDLKRAYPEKQLKLFIVRTCHDASLSGDEKLKRRYRRILDEANHEIRIDLSDNQKCIGELLERAGRAIALFNQSGGDKCLPEALTKSAHDLSIIDIDCLTRHKITKCSYEAL